MTASVDPARAARRAALRRSTLQLVLGVCTLDGLALAVYFLAGIGHGSHQVRMTFSVVWTIATALLVAVLLRRVRRARDVGR